MADNEIHRGAYAGQSIYNLWAALGKPAEGINIEGVQYSAERCEAAKDDAKKLFANYAFSIPSWQQGRWQRFLRDLPKEMQDNDDWKLLHKLSYATDYTEDAPRYAVVEEAKSAKAAKQHGKI